MQLTEHTVDGWTGVLADLAAKRKAAQEHLQQLGTEKKDLALSASMGDEEARKRLAKLHAEINRLSIEASDLEAALENAAEEKKKAEDTAATGAERERQRQITEILGQYYAEVRGIDDGLRLLAARFEKSKQALDRAEALMNSQERTPTQQLRSTWGPTLAAAHFGLGAFIELGPGGGESYNIHRQSLARFAWGFVDRWVTPEAKEETNDKH